VEEMYNKCNIDEFTPFVVIARNIWFRRNTIMYGGDFLHLNLVVRGARESLVEYNNANAIVSDKIKENVVVEH
jgi:hypothetical protein